MCPLGDCWKVDSVIVLQSEGFIQASCFLLHVDAPLNKTLIPGLPTNMYICVWMWVSLDVDSIIKSLKEILSIVNLHHFSSCVQLSSSFCLFNMCHRPKFPNTFTLLSSIDTKYYSIENVVFHSFSRQITRTTIQKFVDSMLVLFFYIYVAKSSKKLFHVFGMLLLSSVALKEYFLLKPLNIIPTMRTVKVSQNVPLCCQKTWKTFLKRF